jgi:phosphatidate cytidylyltransferase
MTAIASEIFRSYVLLVAGWLMLGGMVISALRWRIKDKVEHAWRAYRSWLVMIPLIVVVMTLGHEAFVLFVAGLALCGLWEFATATGLSRDRWLTGVVGVGILGLGVIALLSKGLVITSADALGFYNTLPVLILPAIFLVPIVRNQTQGQLRQVSLAVLGFVLLGWLFCHLALLASTQHAYGYLSFLLFAVEFCDIAAYVVGRTFGKHLLRSEISPKKSWEGAIGSFAVAMALPWLLWFSFPHFRPLDLIVTGLIVGLGGQLGDLAISVIKRDVEVKDMGNVIPGHGGILDRIDSLIFVAPLFFHYVRYFHELP